MTIVPDELTTRTCQLIVQRPDGAGFASTSSDRRQERDGSTFEPDADLMPSELVLSDRMFGSTLQIEGSAQHPAFSIADLRSGLWTGAGVHLLSGDWTKDDDGDLLCEGTLAGTATSGSKLKLTVDVLPAALRDTPCIHTSPECRAIVGDELCRVDMRTRRTRATVIAVESDGVMVDATVDGRFVIGRLRWTSGRCCGQINTVLAVIDNKLVLKDPVGTSAKVGDRLILSEGCDGRRATCSERFNNVANFRGEPDLPGSEILLRFPGA